LGRGPAADRAVEHFLIPVLQSFGSAKSISASPRRTRPSKAGLAFTGGNRFYCALGVRYIFPSTPLNGALLLRPLVLPRWSLFAVIPEK
jgi:hypothetical protein